MKTQNFQNHVRFYPPHHFVLMPLLMFLFIGSIVCYFRYPERSFEFGALALVFFLILWVSVMLRQHYALGNQNRIVRLEMRLRYYQLTQQSLEPIEQQLEFGQLAALRFASDAELPKLIDRTLKEKLTPKQIKQSVKDWQPDYMRV